MSATLSTIGLYNYDPTLFDELVLPEGLEKELAVNTILMRSGQFEVLYPDPDFFKSQIGYWGRKHYRTFEKWVEALAIEYDPLYNYDRTEETIDEEHSTNHSKTEADYNEDRTLDTEEQRTLDTEDQRTLDTEDKRTADLVETTVYNTTDADTQITSETTEKQVAAYDSSTYQNKEKDTHNIGEIDHTKTGDQHLDTTGTDTMTHSGTDTITKSGTDTLTNTGTDKLNTKGTLSDMSGGEDRTYTHKSRVFGNIGITTSMQLLREQLEVQRFNLYDQIADLFVEEFCIMIY